MTETSTFFSLAIYIVGYLYSCFFTKDSSSYERSLLSFPLGFGLYAILITINYFLFEIFSFKTVALSLIFLFSSAVFYIFNKKIKINYTHFSASLIVFSCLALLFSKYDFSLFCGDTFHVTNQSRFLNFSSFCSWGTLLLVSIRTADLCGNFYFPYFSTICVLNFILLFQYQIFDYKKEYFCKKNALFFSILVSLVVITSKALLNISFLIHSNVLLALYLFLFLSYLFKAINSKDKATLFLSGLFCFLCALSRVESPLYCWVFLTIIFLKDESFDLTYKKIYYTLFNWLFSAFYLVLISKTSGTDILSPDKMIFLSGVFFVSPILLTKKIMGNIIKFELILIIFSAFLFSIIYFLFSEHLNKSLLSILQNLFSREWILSSALLLFFLFCSFFLKTKKLYLEKEFLLSFLLCFFLVVLFSLFRTPFSSSLLDSSSRILISLWASILFFLSIKIKDRLLQAPS